MTRRELLTLSALIAGGFLLGFIGGYNVSALRQNDVVIERDTVENIVTVYKDFPQPAKTFVSGFLSVPRCYFLTDTVNTIETALQCDTVTQFVYLSKEHKYFEEEGGKLRLWVSGFQPELVRYEVDWTTTTIIETHKQKSRHWGAGASGGYGVTVFDGKAIAGPSASVFGFYNFNRFGLGISGELNTAAYNGGLLATPSVKVFGFYSW